MKLINADCIEAMKAMPDNSVDSIVTDPPYELGFMGKSWDASGIAFNVDVWREALRVIKPGGHLIAFSGSRTYHRMAVAIEDAGFEIRDQIMYVYGSGFPKSLNVKKAAKDKVCQCGVEWSYGTDTQGTESQAEYALRPMQASNLSQTINAENKQGQVLLTQLQEQSAPSTHRAESKKGFENGKKSSVEGWSDTQETKGQLQGSEIHSLPAGFSADGSQGRVHNGTPISDGSMGGQDANSDGSGQSQESQSIGQSQGEFGTLSDQRRSQTRGSWQICGRCNKPVIDGWGTALKPAHEPMVLARKPLIGTVANNVLTHGTGGLNIDGARVGTDEILGRPQASNSAENPFNKGLQNNGINNYSDQVGGRWPANFIHDGSDEVVGLFPDTKSGARKSGQGGNGNDGEISFRNSININDFAADSGSAARFFYCAKASKRDRNEGLDGFEAKEIGAKGNGLARTCATCGASVIDGCACPDRTFVNPSRVNHHPTVKPTSLMQYLVRLVTPPNGTVLDPFMGSGSTGKACAYEGFDFIGIDQSAEYVAIAQARIDFAISDKLPL